LLYQFCLGQNGFLSFSYNFTVNVSKMGQSSRANAVVTFVDATLPAIKINPFNGLVNPANKLTIKGKGFVQM
jgi:hypothetical protein